MHARKALGVGWAAALCACAGTVAPTESRPVPNADVETDAGTPSGEELPEPALEGPGEPGAFTVTPTFHAMGLTWRPEGPAYGAAPPGVRYREKGALRWREGQPLLLVPTAPDPLTHEPGTEFRGSLVHLSPGTTYDIELVRDGALVKSASRSAWRESFPVLRVEKIASRNTPLVIEEGGSAAGWVVYEAEPGAIIDVENAHDDCVTVKASYVIVRGFTLKGARKTAVELVDPSPKDEIPLSDVVIEANDISGWGRVDSDGFGTDQDSAVGGYQPGTVLRLVVQRNVIHDPRYGSNSWYERRSAPKKDGTPKCPSQYSSPGVVDPAWSCHPAGPQAVTVFDPLGNIVIRYNRVYSQNGNRYNDVFGAGANFSFKGFPGPDSDIYGNDIADCWDDGIEAEGGNQNVRIWGNRIDRTFVGIAVATSSLGPVYVFRNLRGDARVSDVDPTGAPLADDAPKMSFGPFLKTAPRRYDPETGALVDEITGAAEAVDVAAPIRVFHNTVWQPESATAPGVRVGSGAGLSAHQALVRNVWTRNNIFLLRRPTARIASPLEPTGAQTLPADPRNDFDWDLSNVAPMPAPFQAHGLFNVTPLFASDEDVDEFTLSSYSPGFDDGLVLPGLNDGFVGVAPDRGAFEAGAPPLSFGERAYLP